MDITLKNQSTSRWRVLQPAIYLISALPAAICALIFTSEIAFYLWIWVGAAVVLIQHAINVFNDEVDWKKGADIEKKDSWYRFHRENSAALKVHAWSSLVLGTTLGLMLVFKMKREEVLWVALPLLLLGYLYNHPRWTLSYSQWGEWVTGICYGPGVFGCMAYLMNPEISFQLVLGTCAFSFLAVAVLLSHQPPQVLTDFAAGKRSFAVRFGVEKTYKASRALTIACLICLSVLLSQMGENVFFQVSNGVLLGILCLSIPRKVSPDLILKAVSFQVFMLWGLSKVDWV